MNGRPQIHQPGHRPLSGVRPAASGRPRGAPPRRRLRRCRLPPSRAAPKAAPLSEPCVFPDPITLDGRLDESVYTSVTPMRDFIQQEPREGELATEQTDVWILFDARNLYISARCWDSAPEREVANEMRRDASGIVQNESFGITLDTFGDKRNACFSCRARWAASGIRRSPTKPATTSTGIPSGT